MHRERDQYPCRASELMSSLTLIAFRLGKLEGILTRSSPGMTGTALPTCSKTDRPTGTGMRRLIKWLPDILEAIFPVLRMLGPWAWLVITWVTAYIVAASKGFVPWVGSWLAWG